MNSRHEVLCEGHETRKKADLTCLGCDKKLCGYCFNLHIEYFPTCKLANNTQTTQKAFMEFDFTEKSLTELIKQQKVKT